MVRRHFRDYAAALAQFEVLNNTDMDVVVESVVGDLRAAVDALAALLANLFHEAGENANLSFAECLYRLSVCSRSGPVRRRCLSERNRRIGFCLVLKVNHVRNFNGLW